jgi:DNA-binding transcriptional LysR family regulator
VWEMVAKGRLSIGLTRPVIAQPAPGLHTVTLRKEPFLSVFSNGHPLANSQEPISWKQIAREPWIILARREGVSLHDGILAACRRARFTPHFAHTPTVISTVLSYVEAGAGVGIIPDSVARLGADRPLIFRALTPVQTVELVMVWNPESSSPPANAFRALVEEWLKAGHLFPK